MTRLQAVLGAGVCVSANFFVIKLRVSALYVIYRTEASTLVPRRPPRLSLVPQSLNSHGTAVPTTTPPPPAPGCSFSVTRPITVATPLIS